MGTENVKNIGYNFEAETKRSLKRMEKEWCTHFWWERIYDVIDYVARSCPHCHAPISNCHSCGKRFPTLGMKPPKRRGDFHMMLNGVYFLIECKATSVKNGFRTYQVAPHQLRSLIETETAGGVGLLMIKFTAHNNLLIGVRALPYSNLVGVRKFVTIDELVRISELCIFRTPYHGSPYYDLSPLEAMTE